MVIYEVNLTLEAEIAGPFGQWLEEHMKEMLTFDGFESATLLQLMDEGPTPNTMKWTVHYGVQTLENLEQYFQGDAARMREEGLSLFGSSFSATRRIMNVAQRYKTLTCSS